MNHLALSPNPSIRSPFHMSTVVSNLIPLGLMVGIYAALAKLAALLFRRTRLKWLHAFVFCAIAFFIGSVAVVLNVTTGHVLPNAAVLVLGVAVLLCVGGWYLGPRARSVTGEPLGFKGGVLLTLIMLGLIMVVGAIVSFALPALLSGVQP